MNWALTDSFRARSTFGTSFRAPALYELYLANQTSSISARAADPCINWATNLAAGNISQRTADNCAADGIPPDHIATVGPTILTGSAGCFTAPVSLPCLAHVFEEEGALDRLEGFASEHGPRFYGLPLNDGTVTLEKAEVAVPEQVGEDGDALIPFHAGATLGWRLAP